MLSTEARAGGERLAVDPSVISSLMRANASKQFAVDTNKIDEQINTFSLAYQKQWPYASALKPWEAASTKSSDSTADVDGSESESVSGNSGADSFESRVSTFAAPLPVGPVRERQEKPPAPWGAQQAPAPAARPKARRQNVSRKEASKLALQRRGTQESDFIEGLSNSSPSAFAAAWNAAESTGAWKQELKAETKLRPKFQKEKVGRVAPQSSSAACEDMPLPKWFQPSNSPADAGLGAPHALVSTQTSSRNSTDPFAAAVATAFEEGLFTASGNAEKTKKKMAFAIIGPPPGLS